MKVREMREALTQLGSMLTYLRAKTASDDIEALCDLLAEYDEETVQGFVKGIRKRLEDKPAAPKRSKAALDEARVEDYASRLRSAVQGQSDLDGLMAQLTGDKATRLQEIKAIAQSGLGYPITERSRAKALTELRRMAAREAHVQQRLDLA